MNDPLKPLWESRFFSHIDYYFARQMRQMVPTSTDADQLALAYVSRQAGRGDICVEPRDFYHEPSLAPLLPEPAAFDAQLAASSFITNAETSGDNTSDSKGASTPLVRDGNGRLYLRRYWNYQSQLAASIAERVRPVQSNRDASLAAMLSHSDFTVITGGPGTGKTTLAAQLLATLLEQNRHHKIMLLAPTGKAANRLAQTLQQAKSAPAGTGFLTCTDEIRSLLPEQVYTIHKALRPDPRRPSQFRFNPDHPLPADVLLVDECSMVDLPLMAKLLQACAPGSKVILLGDKDQLSSIEAGAAFGDICHRSQTAHEHIPGLKRSIVHLTTQYRFSTSSGIGRLAAAIQRGDTTGALDILHGDYADLHYLPAPEPDTAAANARQLAREQFAPFFNAENIDEKMTAFNRFRILCAVRKGPLSINTFNRGLAAGEPVIPILITENDYANELFNGDSGLVTTDTRTAVFPLPGENHRTLPLSRLKQFETAFALTIHKSQGSEYDNVLLVLPEPDSQILSRELLYTAVTRAKLQLTIVASEQSIIQCLETPTKRRSGLGDLLWSPNNKA